MAKLDLNKLNIQDLDVAELAVLLEATKAAYKSKQPKPISVKAKNNMESVEKHITATLQSIQIIKQEQALETYKSKIEELLSKVSLENYEKNADKVEPRPKVEGRGRKKKD